MAIQCQSELIMSSSEAIIIQKNIIKLIFIHLQRENMFYRYTINILLSKSYNTEAI